MVNSGSNVLLLDPIHVDRNFLLKELDAFLVTLVSASGVVLPVIMTIV